MTAPLPRVEITAREVSELLESAAAGDDAAKALEAARQYARCGLAIRICANDFAPTIKKARIIDASKPESPPVQVPMDTEEMADLATALLAQLRAR